VGPILFDQIWPVYLGAVLAVAVAVMLNRTRHGLNMRAIGEDPAAAHAMGISVRRWQVFYTGICGLLTGFGGAILTVGITLNWRDQVTAGRGWIALALVIFAGWRPFALLWASYVFGGLLILSDLGQIEGWGIPSPFLSMIPYVFTVIVLTARTWRVLQFSGRALEPASLGVTFVREQR
jgi:simple sugar transport system permease protein